VFRRLAQQHSQFVKDLVMNLQALAIVLEKQGYIASCYTCGGEMNSASFMVSLGDSHLIRFLVSDYGITWTEMHDDRELMKLEGAEAISQLQELEGLVKYHACPNPGLQRSAHKRPPPTVGRNLNALDFQIWRSCDPR
jgi:hypothetical protein